ncbi:hypothetical protein ACF0H5_008087 [Mactra antiquata]
MGSGGSVHNASDEEEEEDLPPVCHPCVLSNKPAKAWCDQCGIYLCEKCRTTHTHSHKLLKGKQLPLKRPKKDSLTKQVHIKQAIPVATLEDKDIKIEEIKQTERNILGCISVDNYIVTITRHNLTLYDQEFECIGDIDYVTYYPLSISSRNYDIVVSFRRVFENEKSSKSFKDIYTYKLKQPGCCASAKLVKHRGFHTKGECFTTAVCPFYGKNLTIAAGMKLDSHPERDDIEYQVQIIKSNGQVLQTLIMNPRAEPCFTSPFYLCASMKFEEIVVSEAECRRVRGVSMRTGKTVFEFEGGSPQGVAFDKDDNIYVYNDSAFYWIPPMRQKIHYMQQGYNKKTSSRRETRMFNSIAYNDSLNMLYLADADKSTIKTYKIM